MSSTHHQGGNSCLGHIIRLAAGTDGFFANTLEPLAAFIAAVILPLHPIRGNIDIHGSTNGTHPQSPHYEIHVSLFNSISYPVLLFSCGFFIGPWNDENRTC